MKIIGRLFKFLLLCAFVFTSFYLVLTSQWLTEILELNLENVRCLNLPPKYYVHPVFLSSGPPIQSEPKPAYSGNSTEKSAELFCNYENKTLIIINSHVNHTKNRKNKRSLLSKTWLDQNNAVMYFVVGSEDSSNAEEEMDKFQDIIQTDIVENYHNISYKAIHWIREFSKCSPDHSPQLIIKIDDDVEVDLIGLSYLIKRYFTLNDFIACRVLGNGKVVRNPSSKWYLSKEEYQFNNLGTYCQGMVYLMSGNMLAVLNENIDKTQILWMDDWYVTRALVRDHPISYYSLEQHILSTNSETQLADGLKKIKKGKYRTIFGHFRPVHKFPTYRRKRVWANVTEVNNHCFILKKSRDQYAATY